MRVSIPIVQFWKLWKIKITELHRDIGNYSQQ